MRELFRNNSGFYGWAALRYFLFEYEQHLRKQAVKQEGKIDWNEFTTARRDYVTVEHIFPQTPKLDEWKSFAALTSEQLRYLTNSLGNLLALSQSRNSSFGRRAFDLKKQDAKGVTGYYNGSYSEIEVAQEPDWTPLAIRTRGLKMVEFLENHWSISLGSQSDKTRFLCLEFMGDQ